MVCWFIFEQLDYNYSRTLAVPLTLTPVRLSAKNLAPALAFPPAVYTRVVYHHCIVRKHS